ncbi:MAG: bifunctional methylenetetrahydrofolate dehydrogenase/methenyltetrahydrofolate cyclohydrolase FolD [Spirochaetales bacterium]|nr:MAG: bifunctional methylenetetrahydrofolate dehydrogenase/methenyltetrahydrofolate cyclohydrolase FolD [Spirochaetales bacterium]
MSTQILDGKKIAEDLRVKIKSAAHHARESGVIPGLATVLVGDDPASHAYVGSKQRACSEMGFLAVDIRLSADASQQEVVDAVAALNARPDVHGILVQQPMPRQIDPEAVVAAVAPEKDVDGFHPTNLGRLMRGQRSFVPCTPMGVIKILESAGISPAGKDIVILGRSLLVGKPLASLLMLKSDTGNATVTVCHSATPDLAEHTIRADILIAAIGRPGLVTAEMVKEGAVVIDVGINRVDDPTRKRGYRLVGDVDFDSVVGRASAITPVPGGVGPMTVTMLLYNTVQAARGLFSQDAL